MYRGTTPKLKFRLNFDTSNIEVLYITFKQGSQIKFEKIITDCAIEDNAISCELSQQETLSLLPNKDLNIQIRLKFTDGQAAVSKLMTAYVNDILKDGEI